jgi:3-phosphoshikimate 1-carboxyvinyltransferase
MKLVVKKTEKIFGEVDIPPSKSHSIRGVVFASLAEGTSRLKNFLESEDTRAAVEACIALGAKIHNEGIDLVVTGFNGRPKVSHEIMINTLNSGTTTNIIASVAALSDIKITIDGDESIQERPVQPLLDALKNLGVDAVSVRKNGCPPIIIHGTLKGGKTEVDCRSSQYLTSLLITCPLAPNDTEIEIKNLCEKPYVDMTLNWLDGLEINYENKYFEKIKVYGRQKYKAFQRKIPADWSSATFFLAAGVMLAGVEKEKGGILIKGLDMKDTQADKEVIDYLRRMGADIKIEREGIRVKKSALKGCALDLNNTPDALPVMAVLGGYANGITVLKNVAHARIKETDRIKAMVTELKKMGAKIMETDDGMIIEHSGLKGKRLNGHFDHRIVMALSLAGMIADGRTEINTAEAINVTFPNYVEFMKKLGGKINYEED